MLHPLFLGCQPDDLRPDQHAARGRPHDHRRSGQAYPGGRADPRAGVLPPECVRVQDDEVKDPQSRRDWSPDPAGAYEFKNKKGGHSNCPKTDRIAP